METYPKEVKLKDGHSLILRQFTNDDLENLVQFFKSLPTSERMYLRLDVAKRENIMKRFGQVNYDVMYPILALDEKRIVAIGTLYRAEFGWMRNLGEIRVVVGSEFQRRGLCTVLTKALFFHAISTDLYKIQAELMEDQLAAISCFERLGFKKEAVLRKHVTDIKGNRCNLVIMSLDIQEMWLLMEDFINRQFYVT